MTADRKTGYAFDTVAVAISKEHARRICHLAEKYAGQLETLGLTNVSKADARVLRHLAVQLHKALGNDKDAARVQR